MTLEMDVLLGEAWSEVRERHLFPELPPPVWADGEPRVGLDIRNKRISLSPSFVDSLAEKIDPQDMVAGLLDHAVSHYLYCPWDLTTHLKLFREAKKVLGDRDLARRATDCFMDVVADTNCLLRTQTSIPTLYRRLPARGLQAVIYSLYQRIWGIELGADIGGGLVRKLSRLPYLDRSRWFDSIRRFALIVKPLLEKEALAGELDATGPMGRHQLSQYSRADLEQGLREMARDLASPSEFAEIMHDFENEIQEVLGASGQGMGSGQGRPVEANMFFYMKLAENHRLPLRKKPLQESGALYPHHHTPWEAGRPYQEIDPWTSFGRIMPGITQTWQRIEGEIFGHEEQTPDCMILIDSSGSMVNPVRQLSHAVLGAACAGEAYLRNEARVAVYNFSDALAGAYRILPYSRNRQEIYETLCHYHGGGTRLRVVDIETLQTERQPDIFLITDMQISNLAALIRYFNQCPNRVAAVHFNRNEQVREFRDSTALNPNVSIYAVEKQEDIPRIVLGKIRRDLYAV